jgi:hypothetical protein
MNEKEKKTDEALKEMMFNIRTMGDQSIKDMKDLPEDDKKFVLLRLALIYGNGINAIERTIMQMAKMVRSLLPDTADVLKILVARMEDIDPTKIDELSAGFLENLFTVNDKPVRIAFPETGDVADTEYKRFVIRQVKVCDEQAAVAEDYLEELKKRLNEDIPDDIKALMADVVKADEWTIAYFERKMASETVTEEEKKNFEESIRWKKHARTMQPIIDDLKEQKNTKGTLSGVRSGFFKMNEQVLTTAINVAQKNGFSFPFQMISDLDTKLIKEGKYDKKWRNLIVFLIARYIKYHAEKMTPSKKIFLTSMNSYLVLLNHPDGITRYPELAKDIKTAITNLYDLVLN